MEMINYVFRDKNKNLIDYLKNLDLIFWAKVPQTDMYNYLKNISDNFDKNKFELIIKDIRNYIFEIPYYQKMENLNFSDEKTLKQRFEDVGLIPCLDNVITFSEIAEEKYRSICENSLQVTTPPPSMPVKLTTELNQVRMKAIHQWLTENRYIDVDIESWLYWFDLQTWLDKKKNPSKIKWIGAVYHLTNVVYLLCGNMNKQTETAMKDIFQIPKGSKFQKVTKTIIQKNAEPYNSLYSMMNYAERNIKDL